MSMAGAVNTLRRFCLDIGKDADFENLNRKQLNELLCLFYSDVQKVRHTNSRNINENVDYSKNTINQIRYGLYKYISSINSRIDIIHDPEFNQAESAFKARLDLIDRKATNVTQVIALKDVKRLYYMTTVFDVSEPVGLQCKVLFEVLLYLCQGNKNSLKDMKQDSFKIKADHQGKRYVTNSGVDKSTPADRMYEVTGHRYCPVASFKKYMSRLNPLCNSMWQQPRKIVDNDQLVWYDCTPLDVSIINGMMAEISKNAHLSKIYKNEDVIASSSTLVKNEIFKKKDIVPVESDSDDSDKGSLSDDDVKETTPKTSANTSTIVSDSVATCAPTSLPGFYPGTTWPLEATLELLINYEAVKEVRTVKKQFYPLLYHLTRTDYDSIAKTMTSIKPLAELLKTRYSPTKSSSSTVTEAAKTETVSDGYPTRQASRIRQDTTIISDLQEAKKEVLKLFSRMSLKRQDFARMLCWVQKLDIKVGKFGDQYISESKNEKSTSSKTKGPIPKSKKKFELPEPPKVSSRLRERRPPPVRFVNPAPAPERKKPGPKPREQSKSPNTPPTPKSNFRIRIADKKKPGLGGGKKNVKARPNFAQKDVNKKKLGRPRKESTKESSSESESEPEKDLPARRQKSPAKRSRNVSSSTESASEKDAPEETATETTPKVTEEINDDMELTDYVPNKRFRITEKEKPKDNEQTEIESIYLQDQPASVPVPMCLYKVEGDDPENDDDDDDMQIIESSTWFPPPQVEIENLEGTVIKKENEDIIKTEVFEMEKESNFEPFSNSSSVITSSVQEPYPVELSNSDVRFPTPVSTLNDVSSYNSLAGEQEAASSGVTTWNESSANALPQSDKNIRKSNRTCLGDVCLGEYCPHEHILVAKSRSSITSNNDGQFVITQNNQNVEEAMEIIDSDEDVPPELDKVVSPTRQMPVLENACQSPESTVHTSGNLATENQGPVKSVQDIIVKQEMTAVPNMDDGKEADPIIIIDDD